MDGVPQVLFAILAIALVGVGIWWEHQRALARAAGFRAFAARYGWSYRMARDRTLAKRFAFLDNLRLGGNRFGYDHGTGTWRERPAEFFNFHYQTGSGKHVQHHHLSVVLIRLPRAFPELRIHPEGIFHKLGQAVGFGDIDFESVEFSRRFEVRSPDKKFAYDFCHTRMMEHLLARPNAALELEGEVLASYRAGRLEAADLPSRLDDLVALHELMPGYLFRA